jgi:diaminopimelate decarboxylase
VYRVVAVKARTDRRIVAVDGGMGDNPRPALYGARYTGLSVEDPIGDPVGRADIVGRYCESGDVIVRGVPLPVVRTGDLIAVPMSGAYQLAMASQYNLVPSPAAALVSDGNSRLIVRRAVIEDLLGRDVVLSESPEVGRGGILRAGHCEEES